MWPEGFDQFYPPSENGDEGHEENTAEDEDAD